jgi:hypothetical protein
MAGDWIKMRSDLFTHPKVVRMASALKADTLRTVGGLMSAWCLFDAHSDDGKLDGYTPETLDDHLRWPGFANAMIAVHWLSFVEGESGGSIVLPEFDTHNGQSAKRRAQDADRKKNIRKASASDADKMRTREEKRREENIKASARSPGAEATRIEVIDGDGKPATSVIAALTPAQSAVVVVACKALRKMGAIRFNPGDEGLAALAAEGFTAEQIARCASEKALRDAGLWGDPDVHPELPDLMVNGASQSDMGLTPEQYLAVKSAITQVSIGYIASTLRGRRRDAANQTTGAGHGHARSAGSAGAGQKLSAVERVRAANAAAEQREQAASATGLGG